MVKVYSVLSSCVKVERICQKKDTHTHAASERASERTREKWNTMRWGQRKSHFNHQRASLRFCSRILYTHITHKSNKMWKVNVTFSLNASKRSPAAVFFASYTGPLVASLLFSVGSSLLEVIIIKIPHKMHVNICMYIYIRCCLMGQKDGVKMC